MGANGTDLAGLLVGHMHGVRSQAGVTVGGLIRGALYKRAAPAVVTNRILPADYGAKMEQSRRQQAQAAQQAQAGKFGLTGNKAYDSLPDVVARRKRNQAAFEAYARKNPEIVKRKSQAEIMREIQANGGVSTWGDTAVGRGIGTAIVAPWKLIADAVGSNLSYLTSAPKGTSYSDWMKQYYRTANQDWGTIGHDVANNFQIQANSAVHNASQLARLGNEYLLDWGSYGNSTEALKRKRSYQNTRANADAAFEAKRQLIENNFHDSDLRGNSGSWVGSVNRFGNTAVGALAGDTLATAGFGAAGKLIGRGVMTGTKALSGAIRGASAATNAAGAAASTAAGTAGAAAGTAGTAGASWGARAMQGARNMVANGVDAMGETVAMPFKAVGTFANPVEGIKKTVVGRGGPGRIIWDTARNGIGRPVRGLYNFARHPGASIQNTVMHPWQATKNVFNWGKDTIMPAGRVALGKTGWQADTLYNMASSASQGNYGDAAGHLGQMGFYGGAGSLGLPAMILYNMYGGGGGGDGAQYAQGY